MKAASAGRGKITKWGEKSGGLKKNFKPKTNGESYILLALRKNHASGDFNLCCKSCEVERLRKSLSSFSPQPVSLSSAFRPSFFPHHCWLPVRSFLSSGYSNTHGEEIFAESNTQPTAGRPTTHATQSDAGCRERYEKKSWEATDDKLIGLSGYFCLKVPYLRL